MLKQRSLVVLGRAAGALPGAVAFTSAFSPNEAAHGRPVQHMQTAQRAGLQAAAVAGHGCSEARGSPTLTRHPPGRCRTHRQKRSAPTHTLSPPRLAQDASFSRKTCRRHTAAARLAADTVATATASTLA